jgi:LacI family transcriptional regulator
MRVLAALPIGMSYTRQILAGVMRYARTHKDLEILTWGDTLTGLWSWLPKQSFAGLIAHVWHEETVARIKTSRLTAVSVSNRTAGLGIPQVISDDVAVGEMVAQHFLDRGFRRFGYCGIHHHLYSQQRCEGFQRALAAAGCSDVDLYRSGAAPAAPMERWVKSLSKPVAIMACNDLQARKVIQACHAAAVRVPEEVAVAGVDNDDLESSLAEMPMTSVALGTERIGFEAAALISRLLQGQRPPAEPIRVPPKTVIVRRSSDILAIADPHLARAMQFIHDHAGEPIHVADLQAAAGLSRRVLELRFKKLLGRPPYAEILRAHVERAKELLAHTDTPVKEIAERAGFNDAKEFCTIFHKKTGMTPTQYRGQFQIH